MKTFTDNADRTWNVEVNVSSIRRVRGLLDVDLAQLDKDLLARLSGDPVLLADVLYALCKPQADRDGVSDEQFGEGLAGESIDTATEALMVELVNFSPNPRVRQMLTRAMEKQRQVIEMGVAAIEKHLDDPAYDAAIKEQITQLLAPDQP